MLFVPLLPTKLFPALSSKARKNPEFRPELAEWTQYDQKKVLFGRFFVDFCLKLR